MNGPAGSGHPRRKEVRRVFLNVLDAEPGERDAVLEASCGSDAALRREVEELLAARQDADEELWSLARRAGVPAHASTGFFAEGRRLGAYRLLRQIGQGGMGAVYLAERADRQFEKRVAIKLLPLGLSTGAARERFLAERQILAQLEHPGIARLLDAGIAADGTPYFVMEYVDGEPIDSYCDRRKLGIAGRIDLFLQVCGALEYANRNLVVHRDLKPSNILVTSDGTAKLLDFGIAKVLDARSPGEATELTQLAGRPMTPAYASPEQVRGEPITTATDVYALGVLLYELLAGRPPYLVHGRSPSDLERLVCIEEPLAPSAALDRALESDGVGADAASEPSVGPGERKVSALLDARRRARRLRGDLDTIILMALRKEPERRYRSAAALGDDLLRHREGRPVTARRDRFSYRAGKFARRRPGVVAAVATGLLVVAGFATTLLIHADRLGHERAVAEEERDRARGATATARQVRDFLVDAFEFADPAQTQGLGASARDILDAGAEHVLAALSEEPAVQADMLTAIAEVYLRLNLRSEALPLVDAALVLREEHQDLPAVGILENRWQLLRISNDDGFRSSRYPALVALGREVYGPEDPRFAALLKDHARSMPDRAAAAATFDTAIAILRRHPGDVRSQLAATLLESTYAPEKPPDALDRGLEALEIRRSVYGNEHPAVARALSDLVGLHLPADPVAADTLMRAAVNIHRRTAGESHTSTITLMNNHAGLLRDLGRYQEAEPVFREALRLRRAHEPNEPVPIAYSKYGLALLLLETDRSSEAVPLLRSVVSVFPIWDGRGRLGRGDLVRALVELREFDEAEALLLDLLESSRVREAAEDEREALERLADLYRDRGHGGLGTADRDRLVALTEPVAEP